MPSTRRAVLASGLLALSGCTFDGSGQTTGGTTSTEPTQTTTRTNSRTNTRTDTRTDTRSSDLFDPDDTLQFGKSYVDTGLEITVHAPTIETTFRHDGDTYEMPDGEALAFTPVEFYNTSEEALPIDGPIFTLVEDERTVLETHSVAHPKFDPSIRVRQMTDVATTQRWSAQGGTVEADERLSATAVFEVPSATDRATVEVVYESKRIADDRFGDDVVAWTQ